MVPAAGYSGTPLAKKLGLKPGAIVAALDAPADYLHMLGAPPEGLVLSARLSARADLTHLFVRSRVRLVARLRTVRSRMRDDAVVWVSWPKKASGVATDISEDVVREIALPMGLVDVKVCAVDGVWSGLKLVVRRELRGCPGGRTG